MTIEVRKAGDRFVTRAEGRTTYHCFSFGSHYDPDNLGFADLVAFNDERLPPGTGYAEHPHSDLEIVTLVLSGELRHYSEAGVSTLAQGQVQLLSAGSGVVHSETNPGRRETRFLQSWVRPDVRGGVPSYVRAPVSAGDGFVVLAAAGGGLCPLANERMSLHLATPSIGVPIALPPIEELLLFVAGGSAVLGERVLEDGDSAVLVRETDRLITTQVAGTRLVVWAARDRQ